MSSFNIPLRDPNISKGFGVRYGSAYQQQKKHYLPESHNSITNDTDKNFVRENITLVKSGLIG